MQNVFVFGMIALFIWLCFTHTSETFKKCEASGGAVVQATVGNFVCVKVIK